jgi:hypothetical protein
MIPPSLSTAVEERAQSASNSTRLNKTERENGRARLTPKMVALAVKVEGVNETVAEVDPAIHVNDFLGMARLEVGFAKSAVVGGRVELLRAEEISRWKRWSMQH